LRRYFPLSTLTIAIVAVYLYNLNGTGVISADEPRYAAIGRSMAHTGDWITPKLWGSPWFEKPPLLYWMTAVGTELGLGPELSGRLPVALLSLCFLVAAFFLLRREFGSEAALVSTVLLGTSAGWLAYSQLCVTDLPLSVFFSLAVFIALPLLRADEAPVNTAPRFAAMGVCLGIATLAKGLVPIALAVPFVWFLRRYWRQWWIGAAACIIVAGPWYGAVYAANGAPFVEEFFLKHHFERLYSASLQHVEPWYYYLPVFLAGLFPWTPLVGLLWGKPTHWDQRRRFLAAIPLFGLLLFSASLNKLPGYVLPLLPSIFALIGAEFETKPLVQLRRVWFICCACLIALVPFLATILPQTLRLGRLSWSVVGLAFGSITRTEFFYIALPLAIVLIARRSWRPVLLVLSLAAGAIYLKEKSFPALDQAVSARGLWRKVKPISAGMCQDGISRDWLYGLQFYRGSVIPPCSSSREFRYVLRPNGHEPPSVQSGRQ